MHFQALLAATQRTPVRSPPLFACQRHRLDVYQPHSVACPHDLSDLSTQFPPLGLGEYVPLLHVTTEGG